MFAFNILISYTIHVPLAQLNKPVSEQPDLRICCQTTTVLLILNTSAIILSPL